MAGFKAYIEDTYNELVHKVSWPTWKELQNSAIIVLIAALLIAAVVWVMDLIFGYQTGWGFWKGILGFVYSIFSSGN